ncbi:uracil-DNA glycosylase [Candidatus Liberibacter solanacearum CLso-ZC1]|uniref:Uracil-DNA glycosylase n=1 Tax=Liberibacter solanacearum (strain CLso-ZC1) TaxID=658172 RepID=E4UBG1_LIBSC|nr:uracil-DNA glycosylase [Candidatus Liberibacter solanacearum CLso-ZC1]
MEGVKIHESWKALLESHFKSDYMHNLKEFLLSEKTQRKKNFS